MKRESIENLTVMRLPPSVLHSQSYHSLSFSLQLLYYKLGKIANDELSLLLGFSKFQAAAFSEASRPSIDTPVILEAPTSLVGGTT